MYHFMTAGQGLVTVYESDAHDAAKIGEIRNKDGKGRWIFQRAGGDSALDVTRWIHRHEELSHEIDREIIRVNGNDATVKHGFPTTP
jgi:hypothetical protein